MRCLAILTIVLSLTSTSSAALIDFETTPGGGLPVDDAVLNTPYNLAGGGTVSFYFDDNLNNTFDAGTDTEPLFEAAGADVNEGFASGFWGIPDTAFPGFASQLGNFFLRHPTPGIVPRPFIVDYSTGQTISALSGEIWDIDGQSQATELWLVDVLDAANNILASQFSPLGNSAALDSKPWVFAFAGLPAGVDKVRLTFMGTKINGVGLAFNNFNPTAVPEPGSVVLMGAGLCGLVAAAIWKRRRR